MTTSKDFKNLIDKFEKSVAKNKVDLSSGEDLSIAIMNLISIEEHLFFTSQKTGKDEYLELLNEIRKMRTELMRELIKDYEGEVWCISKHLLAASMRVMEVGTKELKKGNKKKAWQLFDKSYKLYSLFWGVNLGVTQKVVARTEEDAVLFSGADKGVSIFEKLGNIVKKAVDCCKE